MAEKFTVNSDKSLSEHIQKVTEDYLAHHYLRGSYIIGAKRTIPQNRMDFELYTLISEYSHQSIDEVRGQCKLDYGVPIIRRDDAEADKMIGHAIDHLDREEQLKSMRFINVTSLMSRFQQNEFIKTLIDVWAGEGIVWPDYVVNSHKKHLGRG